MYELSIDVLTIRISYTAAMELPLASFKFVLSSNKESLLGINIASQWFMQSMIP